MTASAPVAPAAATASGSPITMKDGKLVVPSNPVIPFIEGDGTGPDIWRASVRVLDAAVAKAYGGKRKIAWLEVLAGEKAFNATQNWLPDATLEAFKKYLVGIKGPLTTPVGGGIRSLNVALRQILDLYVCLRPVRWFQGVPSPVKQPQRERVSAGHASNQRRAKRAPNTRRKLRRMASPADSHSPQSRWNGNPSPFPILARCRRQRFALAA